MKNNIAQEQAFIEFLDQYKKLIIKVSGIYCQDPDERRDLIQEITLQLWKSWHKYDQQYALSTWTYRIALNVSISQLRKEQSRRKKHENYERQWDVIHWQDDPLEERLNMLYQMLEHLKPLDKAIIIMALEGQKNKEIAEVFGISPSNVSTKLLRIKEQLKKQVQTIKH